MANVKKAENNVNEQRAYETELVPFYAFRDSNKYKDDIVVGVNGKLWIIKRGEKVMIPRFVAQILEESEQQDMKTYALIEQETKSVKCYGEL